MVGTALHARAEPAPEVPAGYVPWASLGSVTPSVGRGRAIPPRIVASPSPQPSDIGRGQETYAAPARYPESLWVRRRSHGVRLRTPLLRVWVNDEDRDGILVVTDGFSTVYGAGETQEAAIEEYLENLFFHFDALDRSEHRLGKALRRELAILRDHLIREP